MGNCALFHLIRSNIFVTGKGEDEEIDDSDAYE